MIVDEFWDRYDLSQLFLPHVLQIAWLFLTELTASFLFLQKLEYLQYLGNQSDATEE